MNSLLKRNFRILSYFKTGNKKRAACLQQSCKSSKIAMLRVLQPTNQNCLATNQVAASCEKLLQKVATCFTFYSKICTCCTYYRTGPRQTCFATSDCDNSRVCQSVFTRWTCNTLICCERGLNVTGKTCNIAFKSFCRNFAKQAAHFCSLFYSC